MFGLGLALGLWALALGNTGQVGFGQVDCTVTLLPSQSIQQAIDSATEGAVVCLSAGVFPENIEIQKGLTLRGAGREQTQIKGKESGKPVIQIESDTAIEVRLVDLTAGEDRSFFAGIAVLGKAEMTLTNSQVSKNGAYGIFVQDSAQVTLTDSRISDNGLGGLKGKGSAMVSLNNSQVSGNTGNGLEVRDLAHVSLSNSKVSDNENGVVVGESATAEIRDSVIQDNTYCGTLVFSKVARVDGTPTELRGNGADLCGYAPAWLRKPLVPQTDKTQLSVPGDFRSLQEAVDALAPGGTITIAAGTVETGLTLWKPMTMRGAGRTQTTLKALPEHGLVVSIISEVQSIVLEGLTVTGSASDGLSIFGQAALQDVQVSGNESDGLWVRGEATVTLTNSEASGNHFGSGLIASDSAQVSIQSSQFAGNGGNGLFIGDLARVEIQDSVIKDQRGPTAAGIRVRGSAIVTLTSSQVSGNEGGGLEVQDSPQLTIQNSRVFGNGFSGLSVLGGAARVSLISSQFISNTRNGLELCSFSECSVQVEVRGSTIAGNGSENSGCLESFIICNGIEVSQLAHLMLIDSIIKENADWGLAAPLKQCSYFITETFSGKVDFAGENTIAGNNKSGKLTGKGNPGNHPFKDLPDGQVCLP